VFKIHCKTETRSIGEVVCKNVQKVINEGEKSRCECDQEAVFPSEVTVPSPRNNKSSDPESINYATV